MLMEASADLHALDKSGWSALHKASSVPQCKFMQVLIEARADTELQGEATGLHCCKLYYSNQNPTVIQSVNLLISAKANIEARGGDGMEGSSKTALHFGMRPMFAYASSSFTGSADR